MLQETERNPMSKVIEGEEVRELAVIRPERSSVLLVPVMDLTTARHRLREFQEFVSGYLSESEDGGQDGGDYGVIPGTKKKTLLKSGAEKLCELYGLYDEYQTISSVEDWDRGLFDYTLKCVLKSRRDDSMVGTGVGSCSTFESKYRWRDSQRLCPHCGAPTIIKGKAEYGGGWLCFTKKGGCNAKFKDGDASIEKQVIGRVENPDIIDTKNTALKIAKKRAKIDAVIGVTRSSGIFAQDLDDITLPNQAPVRKEPEKTTQDVEFGSAPKAPATQAKNSSESVGETLIKETPSNNADPGTVADSGECITQGQATNFHVEFRKALRKDKQKDADELAHEWLRKEKIVDVLGKPSALAIRKDDFYGVRDEALAHARAL